MYKVVFLRHGQSAWNLENRFTGWTDVDLTEQGQAEARQAGRLMTEAGFAFDIAYTSRLTRAISTLWLALKEMNLCWLPVKKDWRLNERHYGALQGFNKAEMAEKVGEAQVKLWRRSYDVPPPALEVSDERHPRHDRRYDDLTDDQLPLTECLKDTVERALPCWNEEIVPAIRSGKSVLVVAHGNSLRALVKYLDAMTDEEIIDLNIPTGTPLVYELDENMKPLRHYYLGDAEAIAAAQEAVAAQGKAR